MVGNSAKATGIGTVAILLWGSLALLTSFTGLVPPLQLTAMVFSIAFLIGIPIGIAQGMTLKALLALPRRVWLNGIIGLFGYHLFFFIALRNAPIVEANLVNYLWPLLFVLFSTLLPDQKLKWRHGLGTVLGFLGTVLLFADSHGIHLQMQYLTGYLAALACALIWAIYSVLSRRFGNVPTASIGGFCGVTALLAWALHLIIEETVWPQGGEWIAVVVMGIGPMGLAFFAWDHGVKRGKIATLAALTYFDPLLSTLLLVVAGRAVAGWSIAISCLLITGGAVVASGLLSRPLRKRSL